jgi:hypothetical protein
VGLGAGAIAAGASLLGVEFKGNESDDEKVKKLFEAAGNPAALEALLVTMLSASSPDNGFRMLNELETLASGSEEPELMLRSVQTVREKFQRALNTGDGRMGTVGSSKQLGEYLKGHEFVKRHETNIRVVMNSLGLTKSTLKRLREVVMMDEDVFNALIDRV